MNPSVEHVDLAPGLSMSRILTGLWQIADLERDGGPLDTEAAALYMEPYVRAGLTTFDMADHYGSAEVITGAFRAGNELGDQVQLFTKWVPTPGKLTRRDVREAIERALTRTRSERIDLLQFHAWNYADPSWLDGLFWLDELREEGLIHHLGLTNVDTAHLRMAIHTGIPIVANQICFSLIDRRPLAGMTELCREHGVQLLVYRTVAGGFLTERWLGAREPTMDELETWSLMKYKRFIDSAGGWAAYQAVLAAASTVADRRGVSIANVACRWVLDQPAVGGIIVGARLGRSEHIADTVRLFDFALSEDDRAEISTALTELVAISGDCGDEYRRPPFLTASGDLSHHIDSLPPPYETRSAADGRTVALSGTQWEEIAGYGRAVRRGNRIWVSGTTATHRDRGIGGEDPASQTHFVIDKIEGALQSLGAGLGNVVRTRIYVQNEKDSEPISRAHGERFREVLPASTLVKAGLVGDGFLVEMEAEALL